MRRPPEEKRERTPGLFDRTPFPLVGKLRPEEHHAPVQDLACLPLDCERTYRMELLEIVLKAKGSPIDSVDRGIT
jgi:hypothetical protein